MSTYLILLRGINVGGNNKVSMTELKKCLEELGFSNVITYIASGNVVLKSDESSSEVKARIEAMMPKRFKLDSKFIKTLVLTLDQLQAIIDSKPPGFSEQSDKYRSDAIFLMDTAAAQAMLAFHPREGVDEVWPGEGVIYHQRLDALRTKSRLSKVMGSPVYKSMTIRSWGTTIKLLEIMKAGASDKGKSYVAAGKVSG